MINVALETNWNKYIEALKWLKRKNGNTLLQTLYRGCMSNALYKY